MLKESYSRVLGIEEWSSIGALTDEERKRAPEIVGSLIC